MLNLTKLFHANDVADTYGNRLVPTGEQERFLTNCKNEIRDHLRPRIQKATVSILGMDRAVTPRFRTQGSWAYKTCVQPPFSPPQEIDWDFGVYLPVTVWEDNGPPHKMAQAYFVLVEGILKELCRQKGWTLDSGKSTCIRVQVANWAHIDIPLYAAPEREFSKILEKVALSGRGTISRNDSATWAQDADFGEVPEQVWEDLDHIVMATRSGEWKSSDPEAVARWYRDRVLEHTVQLRRVCRFLKGWRDYHWRDGGGPTSVSIMIAVAQAFEPQRGRDDLALEKAAFHLSSAVLGELRERAIDDGAEDFNSRISMDEKTLASQKAQELGRVIRNARTYQQHMKPQAIADLQGQLGNRLPNRTDLIDADSGPEAIRAIPARRVPSPVVLATQAG